MNRLNKKRIDILEKALQTKKNRPHCAKLIIDSFTPCPDTSSGEFANVMLMLPDNGNRYCAAKPSDTGRKHLQPTAKEK